MGQGHRPAGRDLAFKEGHNRACRPQNITKPDNSGFSLATDHEGLNGPFRRPLGSAHDIGRIDGLVGGNEHEGFGQVPRQPRHLHRPAQIGHDGFRRIGLHQRDMFEGGGMDNHLWPFAREQFAQAALIAHIAKLDAPWHLNARLRQLAINGVEVIF